MKKCWPEIVILVGYALAANRIMGLRYGTTILCASPGVTEWIIGANPHIVAILLIIIGIIPFVIRRRTPLPLRIGCDIVCATILLAVLDVLYNRAGTYIPPSWDLQIY